MKKLSPLLSLLVLFLFLEACKKDNTSQKDELKKISTFNFKPTKPINGELKGVIELGSSGFNSFIIEVDEANNYEVKRKEFGSSLFIEGMTNADEVNEKFKEYVKKMIEYGVSPKSIHFLVSSGAKKSEIAEFVIKKLKVIGHNIVEVDATQEGVYALKSLLPNNFKDKAFVVDIGAGNTKIVYYDKDSIISKETYGSKYFQKNIDDVTVRNEVKSMVKGISKEKRNLCFIIGGAPYNLAETLRQNQERYTVLNTDIRSYSKLVEKKGKKVESGLTIFKAIADETGCKQFVFDWDANFSIGYLLDLERKKK